MKQRKSRENVDTVHSVEVKDFSATQILREIKFGNSRGWKTVFVTVLEALNFDFWSISDMKQYTKSIRIKDACEIYKTSVKLTFTHSNHNWFHVIFVKRFTIEMYYPNNFDKNFVKPTTLLKSCLDEIFFR